MTASQKTSAALSILRSVADTIKDVGRAPSGVIYAALSTHGCTLQQYEQIVNMLIGSTLVKKIGHELIWNGPTT